MHMESVAAGIVFSGSRGRCGCASIATASFEHDTRNSSVTLRGFPNRQRLYDAFHRCFALLPQLDSAEHLHVWPHLAEAMLVVEDILAVLDNPGTIPPLCDDVHVRLCMFMPTANLENLAVMWWPVTAACLDTFGHVWACLFSSELLPGGTTDMFL